MTDNQKYEEAAKAAFNEHKGGNIHLWTVKEGDPDAIYWREIWMKGASFAEKEGWNDAADTIKQLQDEKTTSDLFIARLSEENKSLKKNWDEAITELKLMDEWVKELRQENQRLKEALKELLETGDNVPAKIENARKLIEP